MTHTDDRLSSADRLREKLARHDGALHAYTGDVLYHVQVDYTCHLLDVVDEVTNDPTIAQQITDGIYEALTGDGVAKAAKRTREAREAYEQAVAGQYPPLFGHRPARGSSRRG